MNKLSVILLSLLFIAGCAKKDDQVTQGGASTAKEASVKNDDVAPAAEQKPKPTSIESKAGVIDLTPNELPKSPAVGRVWTSTDGRTLEAELIARTNDTVTLRRNLDKKEFIVQLSGLSDADRVYAGTSSVPVTQVKTFDVARLTALKAAIPTLSAIAPLDSSDPIVTDAFSKYKRSIQVLSPTGYSRSLEMIRGQIESDLNRLGPISGTSLKNPPVLTPMGWSKGSGAWREVWAARSIMAWFNGPLNSYIAELEKLR